LLIVRQKTSYEFETCREFRRVLFRSWIREAILQALAEQSRSVPARFSGTRTMRDCSASACRIAWRIHQTAYEMNLMPLVSSNLWAARIRPRLPSLIKSESDTPWFWYFLATETTNRRLERTSLSSEIGRASCRERGAGPA